jgi:tetratricopeptide (TPR) repeat protein
VLDSDHMPRVRAPLLGGMLFFLSWVGAQVGGNAYYAQCLALFQKGDLVGAAPICQLALVADPQSLPALKLLGRIELELGNLDAARRDLRALRQLDPQGQETLVLEAQLKLAEGQPETALSLLPMTDTPEILSLRAQALADLGHYNQAFEDYRRASVLPEARLGAARMAEQLGHPLEGASLLGTSPEEELLKARLLFEGGMLQQAASLLEGDLNRLDPLSGAYTRALALLAEIYAGEGNWTQANLVLGQLSSHVSLLALLLQRIWPWLVALLLFFGLLLMGESRIEPMRTVELVEEVRQGPGTIYLWLMISLLLALILTALLGHWLYGNWLAAFTPVQADLLRSLFYLLLGGVAFLIAFRWAGAAQLDFGSPRRWVEGVWAGAFLLLLLFLYGPVRRALGLGGMPILYPAFVGLALLEPVIQGLARRSLEERYQRLSLVLTPLLFALVALDPTLYLFMAGLFLGWLRQRTRGVLAGMTAWVVAGVILSLVANLAWVRVHL